MSRQIIWSIETESPEGPIKHTVTTTTTLRTNEINICLRKLLFNEKRKKKGYGCRRRRRTDGFGYEVTLHDRSRVAKTLGGGGKSPPRP